VGQFVTGSDRFDSAALRRLRSITLFVVGLVGIGYEVVIDHADRPTILILLGAMVGLPAFLRTDEKRRPDTPPSRDGDTP
jgi:hypothetical protein